MKQIHEDLIRGKPIKIEKTTLTLPTLDEIFDLGSEKYFEYLQAIILDVSQLDLGEFIKQDREFKEFDIFLFLVFVNKEFQNTFFEAMRYFTGDTFVIEENIIVSLKRKEGEDQLVFSQLFTEEFWLKFRQALILAHWQKEPEKYDYANAKAMAIMKKFKKNKEEVQKIKAKKGQSESLDLHEIVGSVCSHSHVYNLFNIWNLTYYQFFDHYYRLNINDNYHFSLQSILAGADPKKVNIEHWASSIKKN